MPRSTYVKQPLQSFSDWGRQTKSRVLSDWGRQTKSHVLSDWGHQTKSHVLSDWGRQTESHMQPLPFVTSEVRDYHTPVPSRCSLFARLKLQDGQYCCDRCPGAEGPALQLSCM